jgi:hypothetical protein
VICPKLPDVKADTGELRLTKLKAFVMQHDRFPNFEITGNGQVHVLGTGAIQDISSGGSVCAQGWGRECGGVEPLSHDLTARPARG